MREPIYTGVLQSDLDANGWRIINLAGGGSGGSGVADSGLAQLTVGQSYVDVTFSTPQPDAGWILVGSSVANTIDASPLSIWPTTMTNKTATGFRVQLNAIANTANYYLQWAIALGSLILPLPPGSFPVLTRYASNPIINYGGGGWKNSQLTSPIVFPDPTDSSKLIMIYNGMAAPTATGKMSVGIATAPAINPYVWTECPANPYITDVSSHWNDSVVVIGTTVYVYVSSITYQTVDLYVSTNLTAANAQAGTVTFTRTPNILTPSGTETWVYYGSVIREDATHWYMAYVYRTASTVSHGIKLATSSDGIAWTSTGTELISIGAAGGYDDTYIEGGTLAKIGGLYTLTYNAFGSTTGWTIGMAKSSVIGSGWGKSTHNPIFAGSGNPALPDRYNVSTAYWAKVGSLWYLYYQGMANSPGDYNNANWSMNVATLSAGNTPLDFF